jgi:hypothetical protein
MLETYTVEYICDGEARAVALRGWSADDARRTFLSGYQPGTVEVVSIELTEK